MKNVSFASLAILSNAVVPTTGVSNNKFEPSTINKYDYQKFINDITTGLKIPGDSRYYGIVVYLNDSTKMTSEHIEIINIFNAYNKIMQIDPTINISSRIEDFIYHYNFNNIKYDITENDRLYKQLLVNLWNKLEYIKNNLTNFRTASLSIINKKLSDFSSQYNLDFAKQESNIAKNIYDNINAQYYTLLNNAKVQKDGRPYIDKVLFRKTLDSIVNSEIIKASTIHSIEAEMLEKFENEVRKIKPAKNFSFKDLIELEKNTDVNKYEQVFSGLKKIIDRFKSKQPKSTFSINVGKQDYDLISGKTTFNFNTKINNTIKDFNIQVDTKKYENTAIKIKDKIKQLVIPTISLKQNIADQLINDYDFTIFRKNVKKIDDAIKTVVNFKDVSYLMSAKYDNAQSGVSKNSKMNISLELTDNKETDKNFQTVKMNFQINIKRTIDDDFNIIKKSIDARNPDYVFLEEAKEPILAAGTTLTKADMFKFWKYVKPGYKNIENLLNNFKLDGKEYKITGKVKDNTYNASNKDQRMITIDYFLEEENGSKNIRSGSVLYNITQSAVASIVDKLKKLKLTKNNPITDKNIHSYVGKNGIQELGKLLYGVEKVVDDAKNLQDKVIIETKPFYIDGQILYTDFSVYRKNDKIGTEVILKREISHKFIGKSEKEVAKRNNNNTANKYKQIIDATKDKELGKKLKKEIDEFKIDANKKIDGQDIKTETQIDGIIKTMDTKMKEVINNAIKSDYKKLIEEAKKIYGNPLPKEIMKQIISKKDELKHELGKINPKSAHTKDVMKLLKNFDISKILNKAKILSNLSKYALVGISGILGVGGLISLYNALKIWTTNKKMKDIPNSKLKLKSAKKMGLLSMAIGALAIGGSITLILFIFIIKGGF